GGTNMVACLTGLVRHYAVAGETPCFIGSSWGAAMVSLFLAVTRTPARRVILNDVVLEWRPALPEITAAPRADSARSFQPADAACAYLEHRDKATFRHLDTHQIDPAVLQRYFASRLAVRDGRFIFAFDPAVFPVHDSRPDGFAGYYNVMSA